jgi:sporulation protein YlmC with PRC-barrel domain
MRYKKNASIISSDGKNIGKLDRVVIDPKNKEVTHLVANEGIVDKKRVIPVNAVGMDDQGNISLRENQDNIGRFPEFEQTHYISADDNRDPNSQNSLYWYPPILAVAHSGRFSKHHHPTYMIQTGSNIPEGVVALEEGAKVVSRDDQGVGTVESIHTSSDDTITHLVISDGLILKKNLLIPIHWVSHIQETQVYLTVDAELLERLPTYQLES